MKKVKIKNLKKNFYLKDHNQVSIKEYNSKNFYLIPFPKEKYPIYNFDNLATSNNHSFVKDKKFYKAQIKAEKRWKIPYPRNISWRLHFILYFVGFSLNFFSKKDIFIECGTGKGYMAEAIFNYYGWDISKPNFYLIDTFSSNDATKNIRQDRNTITPFCYSSDFKEIYTNFSKYKKVKIIRGMCPSILKKIPKKKIAFLHIDLNNEISELNTFKYLYKRNSFKKGSVVIFDDYGANKRLAKKILTFLKKINKQILMSPTGQGIIIF